MPPKGLPSDDDLKQMFVYNELLGGPRSMLLYPETATSRPAAGPYATKQHTCEQRHVGLCQAGRWSSSVIKQQVPSCSPGYLPAESDLIPRVCSLPTRLRTTSCRVILGPAINVAVKTASHDKFTIWTAPASPDVPLLGRLNMRAPLAGAPSARRRAARVMARTKTALAFYVSRPSAESLRKLVK